MTNQPLAAQLRPNSLDTVIGQRHLLESTAPFRRAVENGSYASVIFWGPPGCGKTTLARILANRSGKHFQQLSAVSDGLPALRKCVETATQEAEGLLNRGTLLFIDEIHRWNKSQQDALLPHVESGLITLVGATTENPSHSINKALRSRCWVLELKALKENELIEAIERGLSALSLTAEASVKVWLASMSSGDARRALSMLERVASLHEEQELKLETIQHAISERDLLHDTTGDAHYNVVSAFIKSMRGSDPDAALYWMARMLEGGEDPMFIARRMVIFASEDIGNADLRALPLATSAMQATQLVGLPEARIVLGQCCTFLASAPKSNAAYNAINRAIELVRRTGAAPVPANIADPPVGYIYPHEQPFGIANQNYWPEGVPKQQLYQPSHYGDEKTIAQRLNWWKQKLAER